MDAPDCPDREFYARKAMSPIVFGGMTKEAMAFSPSKGRNSRPLSWMLIQRYFTPGHVETQWRFRPPPEADRGSEMKAECVKNRWF